MARTEPVGKNRRARLLDRPGRLKRPSAAFLVKLGLGAAAAAGVIMAGKVFITDYDDPAVGTEAFASEKWNGTSEALITTGPVRGYKATGLLEWSYWDALPAGHTLDEARLGPASGDFRRYSLVNEQTAWLKTSRVVRVTPLDEPIEYFATSTTNSPTVQLRAGPSSETGTGTATPDGNPVLALARTDNGWTFVRNEHGDEGFVPETWLEDATGLRREDCPLVYGNQAKRGCRGLDAFFGLARFDPAMASAITIEDVTMRASPGGEKIREISGATVLENVSYADDGYISFKLGRTGIAYIDSEDFTRYTPLDAPLTMLSIGCTPQDGPDSSNDDVGRFIYPDTEVTLLGHTTNGWAAIETPEGLIGFMNRSEGCLKPKPAGPAPS